MALLSNGDQPGAPQYTLEELKVAADTAHQAGRKIAAHAHGAQSIKWAIEAGIDSIEHASLVDDEGIALAKAHGTYFVMDIYNDDYILQVGPVRRHDGGAAHRGARRAGQTPAQQLPQGPRSRRQNGIRHRRRSLPPRRQREAIPLHGHVRHDTRRGHPGRHHLSLRTSSARSAGRRLGSAPGHFADLIAVSSDPLQHIETLEHVDTVVKGGVLIRTRN